MVRCWGVCRVGSRLPSGYLLIFQWKSHSEISRVNPRFKKSKVKIDNFSRFVYIIQLNLNHVQKQINFVENEIRVSILVIKGKYCEGKKGFNGEWAFNIKLKKVVQRLVKNENISSKLRFNWNWLHWGTAIRPSLFAPEKGQARKFRKSFCTTIRPSSKISKVILHRKKARTF